MQVCENLLSTFHTLTGMIWPNNPSNKWSGGPFISNSLKTFSERLASIIAIRTSHELMIQLLDANEKKELGTDLIMKCFDNVNPLAYSTFSEVRWKVCETFSEIT